MKKIVIFLAGVLMLTSCGSTEGGLFSGAAFGSIIGSCIGGISGGPRGHDIGTLVGLATGAAAGAAIGHAQEQKEQQYYAQVDNYDTNTSSYRSSLPAASDESGYSNNPIYNDTFTMDAPATTTAASNDSISINALQNLQTVSSPYPVMLENVRFINADNTAHISRGELVKISFEMRNSKNTNISNIVPTVQETTGNKRIFISPSTMIENLPARNTLRYTAYISAQKNLKTGTAHFVVSVQSNGTTISNVVEFDIALN